MYSHRFLSLFSHVHALSVLSVQKCRLARAARHACPESADEGQQYRQ